MVLREIGEAMGGMDHTAVSMAIKRCEAKAKQDASLQASMEQVDAQRET